MTPHTLYYDYVIWGRNTYQFLKTFWVFKELLKLLKATRFQPLMSNRFLYTMVQMFFGVKNDPKHPQTVKLYNLLH